MANELSEKEKRILRRALDYLSAQENETNDYTELYRKLDTFKEVQ